MLFLLFLFFVVRDYGQALPIFPRDEPQAAEAAAQTRTLFDIVWGCLSTTFICAWVSVHPNVPPPTRLEFGWKSFMRRLRLMFWTLVAPELVLLWAVRQWMSAGEIADVYNNRDSNHARRRRHWKKKGFFGTVWSGLKDWCRGHKNDTSTAWTRIHGHLVAMGGIVLVGFDFKGVIVKANTIGADGASRESYQSRRKNIPPSVILDKENLLALIQKNPNFEILITDEEIEDKSKSDFLSKSIAVLQVTWFIANCIARFLQGLAVTELEVITLALASLNGIMYVFWWSKPLGLALPFRVPVNLEDVPTIVKLDDGIRQDFKYAFTFVQEPFDILIGFFTMSPAHWYERIVWVIFLPVAVLFFPIFALFALVFSSIGSVIFSDGIREGATHVSTFYCPETDPEGLILLLVIPVFGMIFGGLHCLGWNFTFPSEVEQMIWRIASLVITFAPILPNLAVLIMMMLGSLGGIVGDITKVFILLPLILLGILKIIFYVGARLLLLVEAMFLLRQQPATAFLAVDWTRLVPHL